jgi:hypothetical protein
VYLDADIVVGASLRPYLAFCARHSNAQLITFEDIGNTATPFHTGKDVSFADERVQIGTFATAGVMFLRKNVSEPLLELWSTNIMSGLFDGDQVRFRCGL